jgi:hypothetical protein
MCMIADKPILKPWMMIIKLSLTQISILTLLFCLLILADCGFSVNLAFIPRAVFKIEGEFHQAKAMGGIWSILDNTHHMFLCPFFQINDAHAIRFQVVVGA